MKRKRIVFALAAGAVMLAAIGWWAAAAKTKTASESTHLYHWSDYGITVSAPNGSSFSISGGHSPAAHPELLSRLTIGSPDMKKHADIDVWLKDPGQTIPSFIQKEFEDRVLPFHTDRRSGIYKLNGDSFFYYFIESSTYIFEVSSSDLDMLLSITESMKLDEVKK